MNGYELQAVKEVSLSLTYDELHLLELVYIKTIAQGKNIPFSEYVRIDASEYVPTLDAHLKSHPKH